MQNVKATVISPTDIHVTWDKPDAGDADFTIKRYIVKVYRQDSTSVEKSVEVNGSQTTATTTGLSGSTTYRIDVSANNGQNTDAPSEGTLATTEKNSCSGKGIITTRCSSCLSVCLFTYNLSHQLLKITVAPITHN